MATQNLAPATDQDARIAQLIAELGASKAETAALEAARLSGPFCRVTEKGAITFKPSATFDTWPITLDLDQLSDVLAYTPVVEAFVSNLTPVQMSKLRTAAQRKAARKAKAAAPSAAS